MAVRRNTSLDIPGDVDPTSPDFIGIVNDRLRRLSQATSALQQATQTTTNITAVTAAPSTGIRLDVTKFGAVQDSTATHA